MKLIAAHWREQFRSFLGSVEKSLLIVSPYITINPIENVIGSIRRRGLEKSIAIKVITDFSFRNLASGSTDPAALLELANAVVETIVIHLQGVHAKVYVADDSTAIITSANLTDGGIYRNLEYGVLLQDRDVVNRILGEWSTQEQRGKVFSSKELQALNERADDLKRLYAEMISNNAIAEERTKFGVIAQKIDEELVYNHRGPQSDNAAFSDTIFAILRQHGSMKTIDMYPLIKKRHFELCDDRIPYIWNDRDTGPLWKHRVRTAQQNMLKKKPPSIRYDQTTKHWTLA